MRVLVVAEESESSHLAAALRSLGHEVRCVKDEKAMVVGLTESRQDLVVAGVSVVSETALALIRRAVEGVGKPMLLVSHGGLPDEAVCQLIEAGADGDLRRPMSQRYFAARLSAIQRRAAPGQVAASAPAPAKAVAAAAPAPVVGPLERVRRSKTWSTSVGVLGEAAGKFLTLPASVRTLPEQPPPVTIAASILLLNTEHQLEVRVALATDAPSASALAVHLFGEEGADLAGDVMTELANILMGTLKAGFSAEEIPFTGGLPELIPVEQALRPAVPYRSQETALFKIADASVLVYVGLRSRANVALVASRLREGMVVAKDVFNMRGMLLLNGGTRLSETMIERIRSATGPQQSIEVMAP